MATLNLADGESFVKGRNGATARKLLDAAGDRGTEVRTTSYGYILPTDLVPEGVESVTNADLPAVTTEPGTPTDVEHVYNKGGARDAEVGTPLPADAKVGVSAQATLQEIKEEAAPSTEGTAAEETADEFDPSKATIDEVKEYLAGADVDERARVIAAEEAGKQRKGVLDLADTEEGN